MQTFHLHEILGHLRWNALHGNHKRNLFHGVLMALQVLYAINHILQERHWLQ